MVFFFLPLFSRERKQSVTRLEEAIDALDMCDDSVVIPTFRHVA